MANSKIDENMAIHWNPMFMNVCCKFPQEANNRWGSKHGKVCQKNSPKKSKFQKQSLLYINIKKDIKNLFILDNEIIKHFIEFIITCT
jgi:hypothetical protein